MVEQYPHKMVISTDEASTRDADGNWVPGNSATQEIPCRAEPTNGNGLIKAADGTQIQYDWLVFTPLPISSLAPGNGVQVYDGDELLAQTTVKRFSRGQFNARLWL